ncbi:hypothetical protein FM103_07095 [Corynebacterium xerosis]|nr:hypothetical protein FM103_07095 [Corynebacterium xerosis]
MRSHAFDSRPSTLTSWAQTSIGPLLSSTQVVWYQCWLGPSGSSIVW